MEKHQSKLFPDCMEDARKKLLEAEVDAERAYSVYREGCAYREPGHESLGRPDHACKNPDCGGDYNLYYCRRSNCPYMHVSFKDVWEKANEALPNKK
jgi:hypothetical protein